MSKSSSPESSANDREQEIEFATSIDDFQLDFSNEKPEAKPAANDGPSIDDFQFVSHTPTESTEKTSRRDEWFTRVIGQELGPFPFEQLVQMVSDGEIDRDAELRPGFSTAWMIAGEIEGLFSAEVASDDDDFELDENFGASSTGTTLPGDHPEQQKASFRAVGGDINRTLSHIAVPRPTSAVSASAETGNANVIPDQQTEVAAEVSSPPKLTKEEKAAQRKQEIASKLNAWLEDKVPVELKPEPAEEPEDQPHAATTIASAHSYSTPGYPPSTAYNSPSAYTPGAATPKPDFSKFKKKKSSSDESIFAGLGSLFSSMSAPDVKADPKTLIILGVIGLVFAVMYLPGFFGGTNDKKIYDRFKEIYAQIEQARTSNPGQLTAFKGTLVPEIKEAVEALEKAGAGASKPAKQQLFWAGRNCLIPILESPSPQANVYDERFKTHMETAGRLLGDTTVPPVAPPPSSSSDNEKTSGTP